MKLTPGNSTSSRSISTLKYVFSAIIIVLVIISFLTFQSFLNYGEEVSLRVHSNRIIHALKEVEVEVLNAELGHRGYQLTKNPEYLQPYISSKKNIQGKLINIHELIENPDQQNRLDSLEQLIIRQYAIVEEIVAQVNQQDREKMVFSDYEINLLAIGRRNLEKTRQLIDQVEEAENKTLNETITDQEAQSRIVPVFFIVSNIIALIIIIYVFFYIYKLLKVRTETEAELREKQIQLLEAERMVNIGHWSWNLEDNSLDWSDGLYQIYEKSPLTFNPKYKDFKDTVHPDDRSEVLRKIETAVKNKAPYDISFRKKLEDGKVKYVHDIGNPKIDFEDNLIGYFGVTQDITQQHNFQNQIIQQADELKRSNMELEQFAYVASHDLQEPLRKIRAFGDRLQTKYKDKLEETGADYVNRMQNAAERMQILINDLLTFSRVSRKDQKFEKHELTPILEEVLEDLETKISDTDAKIKFDKLPAIVCNPQEMKRLFQNLIGNALKFKKPDEPPVVSIKAKELRASEVKEDFPISGNKHYLRISVKDEGIGFHEKFQERIFNIFQRLHGRSTYKGTGIGLAICRKIVANHEGFITAKGEENNGAEFIIVLPKKLNKNNHERA
ncbi:MAG: sensor histidine kinase [Candidatus Cyclobacteriaceae bacterium M2_1C_046]